MNHSCLFVCEQKTDLFKDHGSINDNGDGTWTATVKNLDPKVCSSFTILISRLTIDKDSLQRCDCGQ